MQTSVDELNKILSKPKEDAHLEFKRAQNQFDFHKLLQCCVALSNEGGGRLVLGVTDEYPRSVTGTAAFPDLPDLERRVLNKIGMRIEAEEILTLEKRVVIVHAPSRPRGSAYHLDGAYLMRAADSVVPMSEDRLRKVFDEGKPDWLLEPATQNLNSDEIIQLLETQTFFDLLKLPYPTTRDAVIDQLNRGKLVTSIEGNWRITNLGALILAKRLSDFENLERKAPRVIVYSGPDKLETRIDRIGGKGYAVGFESLLDFINTQIQTNEVIGTALRKEVKMFPEAAIRELVANALIHQDFGERGTSVVIELFSDRMEISNPGEPFIAVDRFIDGYQSRNEKLADLMRRMGICEEKGSGIDKVIYSAEAYQLPAPDFRTSERRTISILFAHKEFEKMDRNDRIRACYQHCCLQYLMNKRMTNQSLRERFKLPESKSEAVSRIIRETLEAKQISQENPANASRRYSKYVPFWA
jgi:ATP-dependent DNA helicase RecG